MSYHVSPATCGNPSTLQPGAGQSMPQGITRTVLACAISAVCAAGFVTALTVPGSALAADPASAPPQSETKVYDIPPGPLEAALNRFGREAGVLLSFLTETAVDRQSQGLRGNYSVPEGLQRLLQGTGLSALAQANGSYALVAAPADSGQASTTLPAVTVSAKADVETAYGPVQGYKAERSATATKTDTAIIDTPASIQVVPREVIEDQNAQRVADVLENVSGVQSAGTQGNLNEVFTVRGFQQSRLAKDGFLAASSFTDVGFLDLANIERVEVLKGPASVLYGLTNPGGLINLVTKKPQEEVFYTFKGTAGSFDLYRGEADINRPLNADKSLLFRLNTAYQESDSFRDYFIDADRIQIAPSLRWLISEDTTVDLQLEYYDQEQQFDRGLVAIGDRADVLPQDRYLGERFSQTQADELRFNAILDHQFNESWALRSSLRVADSDQDRFAADPESLQADGRTLSRRASILRTAIDNYAAQMNLMGAFDTGFLGHELLIGVDANFTRFDSSFQRASLASIDVFDPVYGAQPGTFGSASIQDRRIDFYGLYLQDLVSFGEHWKLLLGGRYDHASTEFERDSQLITDANDREFSPRAGLVFQPIENLSLYASYTESFLPFVFAVSQDGSPFEPEFGEQIEVGVKRDWFEGRLSTTLAVFDLTRQNVLTPDPENSTFSIQTGEQRSRGVEMDVTGEILPGWNVISSVTYLDAEITEDNRFSVGNRLQNVPRWSGSFWSTYEFRAGVLNGLELGGGVFAVGRREGDLENSFEAAGYARVDAFAQYRVNEHVQVSLNVRNLFDKDYIQAPIGRTEVYPGAPLTVLGSIKVDF